MRITSLYLQRSIWKWLEVSKFNLFFTSFLSCSPSKLHVLFRSAEGEAIEIEDIGALELCLASAMGRNNCFRWGWHSSVTKFKILSKDVSLRFEDGTSEYENFSSNFWLIWFTDKTSSRRDIAHVFAMAETKEQLAVRMTLFKTTTRTEPRKCTCPNLNIIVAWTYRINSTTYYGRNIESDPVPMYSPHLDVSTTLSSSAVLGF